VVNNQSGGTFDVQTDGTFISHSSGTAGSFNNAGLLKKTGTGISTMNIAFDNTGTVDVQSGTLKFVKDSTTTGSTAIQSGATLKFTAGTHIFDTGATIPDADGNVDIAGGTVNFYPAFTFTTLNLSGGSANFNADATIGTLNHSNGTLGGTGTVTVSTSFAWSRGTMEGGGTTTIGSGVTNGTISGSVDYKNLVGRTFNNGGNITYTAYFSIVTRWLTISQVGHSMFKPTVLLFLILPGQRGALTMPVCLKRVQEPVFLQ
jgi:hypothetical protein